MKDCWHFITKDGLIFTTRGNIHPTGYVRSVGLYLPHESGDRIYFGKRYLKKVDEYGNNWVKDKHPEYIDNDEEGTRILVPIKHIDRFFNPFRIANELRDKIKKTKWGKLILVLEKIIPKEDIGFIGSYLIGFPTKKSDIDIVIRGLDNLKIIKNKFNFILDELCAVNDLDDYLINISLEKYYSLYSRENNDFLEMIKNRWPTIRTKEYMTKLRFIPKDKDIEFPVLKNKQSEIKIRGKVTEDIGTNFTPRFFKIMTEKGKFTVLTYYWDYTYCVKTGDEIIITGNLYDNNTIAINDRIKNGITFN